MINIYPYTKLGFANHGWLKARHHFSFAHYYNPERMGFGALRVINDDIIKAGAGFDTHPHRDMEIITFVRAGAITHRDSQGNQGRTEAGDVQVMSAGTGIFHSEYNLESIETNIFQIWIEPKKRGIKPRWDTKKFPKKPVDGQLSLLVSGDGKAPLQINQDAFVYAGTLKAGTKLKHNIHVQAYVLVSTGSIQLNGKILKKGDGAEVQNLKEIEIHALNDSEILVLDVPTTH